MLLKLTTHDYIIVATYYTEPVVTGLSFRIHWFEDRRTLMMKQSMHSRLKGPEITNAENPHEKDFRERIFLDIEKLY